MEMQKPIRHRTPKKLNTPFVQVMIIYGIVIAVELISASLLSIDMKMANIDLGLIGVTAYFILYYIKEAKEDIIDKMTDIQRENRIRDIEIKRPFKK